MTNPQTTLIICYGNDLMGNDAFGRCVFEALPDGCEKVFTVLLLPELLEKAKGFERLIFVDAAHGKAKTQIYEIYATDADTADFHHLSAEGFLRLLEVLYAKTPKAYMCAAFFEEFEAGILDGDFLVKKGEALALLSDFAM